MTFEQWMVVLDKLPNLIGTTAGIAALVYARLAAKRGKQIQSDTQGTQDWQNRVLGRVVRLEAAIASRGRGKRRHTESIPTVKEPEHDPW